MEPAEMNFGFWILDFGFQTADFHALGAAGGVISFPNFVFSSFPNSVWERTCLGNSVARAAAKRNLETENQPPIQNSKFKIQNF
jgi:hypothetical protein